jgi:hypothetical protein
MAYLAEIVRWISAGVTAVVDGTPRTAASVNAGLTDLANRTRWLKDRLYDLLVGTPLTISAVNTGTDRLTVTSHGIPANSAVQVFAANGGSLPGGLAVATVYYVDVPDANTIKLSTTSGPGAAVDLTAGFVGDCYVQIIPDWLSTLLIADATYGYGKLTSLVVFLAGAQTITGAKGFSDITATSTNKYKLASRGITRVHMGDWYEDTGGLTRMAPRSIPVDSVSTSPLQLPNGSTLTEVTFYLDPANHSGTGLPGTMPTFQIWKQALATGVSSQIGSTATDASVDATAYSALHTIVKSGLSEVIDNANYRYWFIFTGEGGAI